MAQEKKGAARAEPAEGNVDQIREILFGGQMRDYDRRFSDLEERLQRDLDRFRQDQHKRLEAIEQLIRDESESSAQALKRLDAELRKQASSHGEQLKASEAALRGELAELASQLEDTARQLRERLLKLGQETADGLQQQSDDFNRNLSSAANELREAKVAREELAGFFTEMALRLKRDFDLPGE